MRRLHAPHPRQTAGLPRGLLYLPIPSCPAQSGANPVPIFPLEMIARRAGDKRANVAEQQPIKRDAGLPGEFQDSATFLPTRQGFAAQLELIAVGYPPGRQRSDRLLNALLHFNPVDLGHGCPPLDGAQPSGTERALAGTRYGNSTRPLSTGTRRSRASRQGTGEFGGWVAPYQLPSFEDGDARLASV